jgi:carboxylesterase type B
VTIFGESAGAGSMSAHLVMPESAGLFSGVVMESGAFSDWTAISMACAEENFNQLLLHTGCDDVDCLLATDAVHIKRASEKYLLQSEAKGCAYAAVVDGVELTTHPWIALSNGNAVDVPIMLGTNSDEGAIFTTFPHDGDEEELHTYWSDVGGFSEEDIVALTDFYVTDKTYDTSFASTYWWAAERTWTDSDMSCPSEYVSQQLGAQQSRGDRKSPFFFYHFEHLPRQKAVVTRHVSEIPYVFHQSELLGHPDDLRMADVMASWWGNFFSSGDPNQGSMGLKQVPKWDAYDAQRDNVLVIRTASEVGTQTALKQEECGFFIPYLDNAIRGNFPEYSAQSYLIAVET